MLHRSVAILPLVALAACGRTESPAADSARPQIDTPIAPAATPVRADSAPSERAAAKWVVTPKGVGPVLAGTSIAALSDALGERLRAEYAPGASCGYVRASALPRGVIVMVDRDTVVRVDVRTGDLRTAEGVGIGDSEADVLKRYEGRVRVTPGKYTGPAGHDLTVTAPPDTLHRIVFETAGQKVVQYRAGRRAAVDLVEGCA
jgi:hypothetical protein